MCSDKDKKQQRNCLMLNKSDRLQEVKDLESEVMWPVAKMRQEVELRKNSS